MSITYQTTSGARARQRSTMGTEICMLEENFAGDGRNVLSGWWPVLVRFSERAAHGTQKIVRFSEIAPLKRFKLYPLLMIMPYSILECNFLILLPVILFDSTQL